MQNRNNREQHFYLSSGDWSTVVRADDRSSALKKGFEELLKDKMGRSISSVIICLNVDATVNDLSLEDSLKFIPTADAADEIGNSRLSAAIKSLFNDE
jgi:hypothetical protein